MSASSTIPASCLVPRSCKRNVSRWLHLLGVASLVQEIITSKRINRVSGRRSSQRNTIFATGYSHSCNLSSDQDFPNSVIPSKPQQHSLEGQKFSALCEGRQKHHWKKFLKFKILFLTSLTNEPPKIQSGFCREVPWSHLETDLPKTSTKGIFQLLQLIPLITVEKKIQINWKKNLVQVFLRN